MAKSKPIGVRFNENLREKFSEMGIITPQKVLNFLEDFYLQNIGKVVEVNNKPENKERILNERNGLLNPNFIKETIDKNTPPIFDAISTLANNEEILNQIGAIRAETLPKHISTPLGKKSWQYDQNKRIETLQKQLK